MDQKTITVLNWLSIILLVPATIMLAWKMVSDKFKGRKFSSEMVIVGLGLVLTALGLISLNLSREVGWLRLGVFVAQLIAQILLFKSLWTPLKRQLRG